MISAEIEASDAAAAGKKKKKKKKKKAAAADSDAKEDESVSSVAVEQVAEVAEEAPIEIAEEHGPQDLQGDAESAAAKKKKKKRGGGGGGGGGGGAPALGPTEDATARYQRVLDALRDGIEGSEAGLSRCGLGDKKLRALVAALRTRGAGCTLAALDLSHNSISDAGAVALCAALAAGEVPLVPQLASLNIAANPLGTQAAEACAHALAGRPTLSLVLPAGAAGGARGAASAAGSGAASPDHVSHYFGSRGEDDVPPPSAPPPPPGPDGRVDLGPPLLGGTGGLTFEGATAVLLEAAQSPATAAGSVGVADAARALLECVEADCAALNPNTNAKLLPRALKWCAGHVGALSTLLLPPPRPRVTYGEASAVADDPWAQRLGARRLALIEVFERLISARRPLLTSALAEQRPSPVCLAVSLLAHHPAASVLGAALVRLVRATLQAKPIRVAVFAASLTGSAVAAPPLPNIVATALAQASGWPPPLPARAPHPLRPAPPSPSGLSTARGTRGAPGSARPRPLPSRPLPSPSPVALAARPLPPLPPRRPSKPLPALQSSPPTLQNSLPFPPCFLHFLPHSTVQI